MITDKEFKLLLNALKQFQIYSKYHFPKPSVKELINFFPEWSKKMLDLGRDKQLHGFKVR